MTRWLNGLSFAVFFNSSLPYISIDQNHGNDAMECLQGQISCQSLMYVSGSINNTGNLTIEIIGSALSLQGSAVFTDIFGLTMKGERSNIECSESEYLTGSGIVFKYCTDVKLIGFTMKYCGLLYKSHQFCGLQAILFYNCTNIGIVLVNFKNCNGTGLVFYDASHFISIENSVFLNNGFSGGNFNDERETTLTGGGVRIIQIHNAFVIITMCQFVNNSATFVGGSLYMNFSDAFQNAITIIACNFTSSIAGISGGAIGITVYGSESSSQSSNYSINFRRCIVLLTILLSLVEELPLKYHKLEFVIKILLSKILSGFINAHS